MAFVAGSIVVKMDGDVKDLAKASKEARSSIDSIGQASSEVSKSSQSSWFNLGDTISFAIGGVVANAFTSATSAAKGFFDAQMNSAKDFEVTRIAFDGIIGDTQKAGKIMDEVVKNAAATPFEIPELANSAKMLAAFGVAADDVIPSIMMVGDVSAGLNVPIEQMAYLVGTIKSSGKAMTADLNQFANRGVPIWKELSKVTGKSEAQLRDMASEGKITYDLIEKAFKGMTAEGGSFYEMMKRISSSGKGLDSTLSDTFGSIGRRIIGMTDKGEVVVGGLYDKIKKSTAETIAFLSQPAVINFAENIGKGIGAAFDEIGKLKDFAKNILPDIAKNIDRIKYVSGEMIKVFRFLQTGTQTDTIFGQFSNSNLIKNLFLVRETFLSLLNISKLLYSGDFSGGIFGLSEDAPFINFLFVLRENIIFIAQNALPFAMQKFNELSALFTSIANVVMPYIVASIKYLADSWTTILLPGIQLFWQALQPLIKNIVDIITMIAPHVMPFLAILADYFINYFAPLIGSAMQLVAIIIGAMVLLIINHLTNLTNGIKFVVSIALQFFHYFGAGIRSIFVGITQFLTGFIDVLVGIFTGNGDKVRQGFLGMFNGLGNIVKGIFEMIGGMIRAQLNNSLVNPVNKMIDGIPSEIAGVKVPKPPKIPSFRKGVENFSGGAAIVHDNELLTNLSPGTNVFTKSETEDILTNQNDKPSITINIGYLLGTEKDKRELVSALDNALDTWIERKKTA